jgi:hypothetical protein
VKRFFRELCRRGGRELALRLVVAVDPGNAARAAQDLGADLSGRIAVSLPPDAVTSIAPEDAAARARDLEHAVGDDPIEVELHLPRIIALWEASDEPERAVRWRARALAIYAEQGLYEAASIHGEDVLPHLDALTGSDEAARWDLVRHLVRSLIAAQRPHESLCLLHEEVFGRITDPEILCRAWYEAAMLHARHLPERNVARAERYLRDAMGVIAELDLPAEERHFELSFLNDALALLPGDALMFSNRAMIHYQAGRLYAALSDLDEAIALAPDDADLHENRSVVREELDRGRETALAS